MMRIAPPLFLLLVALTPSAAGGKIGIFDTATDVGVTPKSGSVEYNAATGEYRVTGGGANMWASVDAFEYVWSKMSGDVAITADIQFLGAGAVAHRKAVLVVRQNLQPGSVYADVAVHGDGLTSLQYRAAPDAVTEQVVSELKAPVRVRLERRGNRFMMYAGNPGEALKPAGPATVALTDPVYVGIGVCSHNVDVLETAIFSNVKVEALPPQTSGGSRPRVRSKLSIYDLAKNSAAVYYSEEKLFEAPNWSPDGKYLMINSGGDLYRLPVDQHDPKPEKIELAGGIRGCNNDHGISHNGKMIAFSARHNAPGSQVYVANADGSNVKKLTDASPSYYHGWSPDGKWLAFVGQRNGNFDVYRVSVNGGEEQRLTTAKGLDDGPDYSPDGKWIYVNSERTGNFEIWRFPADGSGPIDEKAQRVTNDEREDWFPHPSPDGKWMVFVSFENGTQGHPANKNVELRMMPLPGDKLKPGSIRTVVKLFGGQGTINVNSWAPDSKRFAFVSYELLPAGESQ